MKFYFCLFILVAYDIIAFVSSQPTASENFPHSASLDQDGRFWLFWKIEDIYITFEMHGQTTGWVGVGISPSGGMIGADMFVGWVKDGIASVTDRHGLSFNTFPPQDEQQDLTLLGGNEQDGWTRIKFRRQIAGCEENEDISFTTSTTRMIWAMGSADPQGNDITIQNYHGSTGQDRGGRNLLVLEAGVEGPPISEEDTDTFTFLNDEIAIPAIQTYYNCKLFEFPRFSTKRHVIQIDPVIEPGNENFVHHILVYQCRSDPTDLSNVNTSHSCRAQNMPDDFRQCELIIHAWAIGGGPLVYPDNAGFPIGTDDSPRYIMMEVHYDNPGLVSDVVDNSGVRFIFTRRQDQLREFDAGVLETGRLVFPYTHFIPPNIESFLSHGECPSGCIGPAINHIGRNDIRLVGAFLHTHLLGRALTLRHIAANGTELPYIAIDTAYDFNYQEGKIFPQEVTFTSGDSMQLICNYNSMSRENFTLAGLGTPEEMCLAYIIYYPKIPLTSCAMSPIPEIQYAYFGIENSTIRNFGPGNGGEPSLSNVMILAPPNLVNLTLGDVINAFDWTEEYADGFSQFEATTYRFYQCRSSVQLNFPAYGLAATVVQPYNPPVAQCVAPTQPPITTTSSGTSIRGSILLVVCAIFGFAARL